MIEDKCLFCGQVGVAEGQGRKISAGMRLDKFFRGNFLELNLILLEIRFIIT